MENLFEKGGLVQLSTSIWGACRKVKPEQFIDKAVSAQWLSASKKLVDPDALKPIKKVVNSGRSYLCGASLPFPIQGMAFVPKEMITKVDEKLDSFKGEFDRAVDSFIASYDQLRDTAKIFLGDLFKEIDYPVNVRSKFSFAWRFVILDVPNGNTAILAPEVYEREKEKFIQSMDEARSLAIQSLRQEFANLVERITDRFATGPNGKPKVFKNSTVNNFYEYFETFKQRNIFKDDQLAEMVDRAKAILGGSSAEIIRSDNQLKRQIGSQMKVVEDAMTEILARPRRKIIMN